MNNFIWKKENFLWKQDALKPIFCWRHLKLMFSVTDFDIFELFQLLLLLLFSVKFFITSMVLFFNDVILWYVTFRHLTSNWFEMGITWPNAGDCRNTRFVIWEVFYRWCYEIYLWGITQIYNLQGNHSFTIDTNTLKEFFRHLSS